MFEQLLFTKYCAFYLLLSRIIDIFHFLCILPILKDGRIYFNRLTTSLWKILHMYTITYENFVVTNLLNYDLNIKPFEIFRFQNFENCHLLCNQCTFFAVTYRIKLSMTSSIILISIHTFFVIICPPTKHSFIQYIQSKK